ncbi:hypothetical protein KM043_013064 [Ampulex compressa]|nr:hypothetical protein KM043_013064 [Ampulex compressa]
MAALVKVAQISKTVINLSKSFINLSLSSNNVPYFHSTFVQRLIYAPRVLIHNTPVQNDLMEFFDAKDNWSSNHIKVGRSWKKDELRIKANEDLHKLWFVLLKERNMLLTMEELCKNEFKPFPNPERLDKVQESMSNIETVVRERNKAYHMLETGEHGERPAKLVYNALGLRFYYKMRQYTMPKYRNKKWHTKHMFGFGGFAVRKFLRLYREKIWNSRRIMRNREKNRVTVLLRKFPNVDIEALKREYPTVNIEAIRNSNKTSGHYVPE